MKAVVAYGLAASLSLVVTPAPAAAQDALTTRALASICMPYAKRQQSFERSIRAARDLQFRRPVDDRAALDEWASEVELVSRDGSLRLRLEENTIEVGDRSAYAVTCSVTSRRATGRELSALARRAFRNERYWMSEGDDARAWNRRSDDPEVYQLQVRIIDEPGAQPAIAIKGLYF